MELVIVEKERAGLASVVGDGAAPEHGRRSRAAHNGRLNEPTTAGFDDGGCRFGLLEGRYQPAEGGGREGHGCFMLS